MQGKSPQNIFLFCIVLAICGLWLVFPSDGSGKDVYIELVYGA